MTALSYFQVNGTWEPSSTEGVINGNVSLTMLIENDGVLAAPTLDNPAVVVPIVTRTAIHNNTMTPVSLAANTAPLGVVGTLYYRADFSDIHYVHGDAPPAPRSIPSVTFAAPTDTTPVNLATVTPSAGVAAVQLPSVTVEGISNATALGRELLTATGQLDARTDTGAAAYLGPAASQAEMIALQGNVGDYCKRTDLGVFFVLTTAPATSAANWSVSAPTVVDNTDGTLAVNGINTLEPVSTITIATTSASPTIGRTTYYNAKIPAANLTPQLPPLTGLRVGARLAVRRDPTDDSAFTVTLSCAGTDTFFSSGATATTLPLYGEQREYQVVSVAGTKYWAPAGSLNPVPALDKRYLHVWPFPMARNTIAAIGDSLTYGGSYGGYLPGIGHNWLGQLQLMTHQRIRYGAGNFAVSGTTIAYSQTTELPQVLAMNPLPGACVLAVANGDVRAQAAPNTNFAATVATLKAMVASLLAVGVVPILWTIPPETGVNSPVAEALYQANIHQWNTYIRRYAALNGFPIVDAHTALAAADGTFLPGLLASDQVHPNGAGHRTIAQQVLADGLADIFPPNSLIHTARQTNDLSTLFNDGTTNLGLFTTDSNADGVADGLTTTGTATFSLVAPVAADNLRGNWQQVTVTAGNQATLTASLTTGWSVGDVIAFSARVQTQGIESSGATWVAAVLTDTPGGYVTPNGTSVTVLYNGVVSWQSDISDGEVYVEFPVLTQMTDMKLFIWIQTVPAGTATVRVGEATIRNLTTGGLLI